MQMKLGLILGAVAVVAATPVSAQRRGDEPIAVPRTVKQGIDFVYVDPQMSSVAKRRQRPQNWLQRLLNFDLSNERRRNAPHPMFFGLARGLQQYQAAWGRLPQVKIPAGPTLKRGPSYLSLPDSYPLSLFQLLTTLHNFFRSTQLHVCED